MIYTIITAGSDGISIIRMITRIKSSSNSDLVL